MLAALFLPLLATGPGPVPAGVLPNDPPIELSINNDRRFLPGDRVEVRVRAAEDGYLIVLHADPDGHVHVLFPLDPRDDNFVHGGKRYEIRGRGDRTAFEASITGQGMVYAAVSRDPFRFDQYTLDGHWDYQALAPERLPREPEAELTELVRGIAQSSFDYDVLTYDVIERVYASESYYQPSYSHWANNGFCDPFYYNNYCRSYYGPYYGSYYGSPYYGAPYYGSYLSVSLVFGHPYQPYYYGYNPFFYDPFYYRPVYYQPVYYAPVYAAPHYVYNPYWYSPRRPYYAPLRPRGLGGFNDYRDRRYTFAAVNDRYRSPFPPARGLAVPVRRATDRVESEAVRRGRVGAAGERRGVERRSDEPRPVERDRDRRPAGHGEVEAHRAREREPRPNINYARPPERGTEARRVERRGDDTPRDGGRGSAPEARPSRRDDPPRQAEPQSEPRRRDGDGGGWDRGGRGGGGGERGMGSEGGGGGSRPSHSEGRGGGRRR